MGSPPDHDAKSTEHSPNNQINTPLVLALVVDVLTNQTLAAASSSSSSSSKQPAGKRCLDFDDLFMLRQVARSTKLACDAAAQRLLKSTLCTPKVVLYVDGVARNGDGALTSYDHNAKRESGVQVDNNNPSKIITFFRAAQYTTSFVRFDKRGRAVYAPVDAVGVPHADAEPPLSPNTPLMSHDAAAFTWDSCMLRTDIDDVVDEHVEPRDVHALYCGQKLSVHVPGKVQGMHHHDENDDVIVLESRRFGGGVCAADAVGAHGASSHSAELRYHVADACVEEVTEEERTDGTNDEFQVTRTYLSYQGAGRIVCVSLDAMALVHAAREVKARR